MKVGRSLALALVAVVGLAAAIVAGPAPAQTSGGFPKYLFEEEDGTVRIEGDAVMDCPSFALSLEEGYFESGYASPGARRVLGRCVEAGLLEPGLAASVGARVGASEAPGSDGEGGGLPGTGGPGLPALLMAVSSAAVIAGGLLVRDVAKE